MFSWGSKIFKNPNLEFLGKLNLSLLGVLQQNVLFIWSGMQRV